MTRDQIIEMYEEQIKNAESNLEASSIKFEMKKHLEAFDNGYEYRIQVDEPITCIGCGS